MRRTLNELAAQAQAAHDAEALLKVVDEVYRLIEQTPGLRNWLLPANQDTRAMQSQRKVTIADAKATDEVKEYRDVFAQQLINAMPEHRENMRDNIGSDVNSPQGNTDGHPSGS